MDEYLRTTVPDVYAAGDVCGLSGIWPNAMKQGITAARNMCGQSERYEDTYAMKNTMNFFGLPALCLGDINRVGADTQVIKEEDSRVYRKALVENGRLKAILMLGDISASGIFQYLIKMKFPFPAATGISSASPSPISTALTRRAGIPLDVDRITGQIRSRRLRRRPIVFKKSPQSTKLCGPFTLGHKYI